MTVDANGIVVRLDTRGAGDGKALLGNKAQGVRLGVGRITRMRQRVAKGPRD